MERDGMRMARAKTTALTKRIDDMLDSWNEYEVEKNERWSCKWCRDGCHYVCEGSTPDCMCAECEYAEGVSIHASS